MEEQERTSAEKERIEQVEFGAQNFDCARIFLLALRFRLLDRTLERDQQGHPIKKTPVSYVIFEKQILRNAPFRKNVSSRTFEGKYYKQSIL